MRLYYVLLPLFVLFEKILTVTGKSKPIPPRKSPDVANKNYFSNPCEFPTIDKCHPAAGLKQICDVDSLASLSDNIGADKVIAGMQPFAGDSVKAAVAVVRQLRLPPKKLEYFRVSRRLSNDLDTLCLEVTQMLNKSHSHHVVEQWYPSEVSDFVYFYAETLRKRWFDGAVCASNFLLLVVSDGVFDSVGNRQSGRLQLEIVTGSSIDHIVTAKKLADIKSKALQCFNSQWSGIPAVVVAVIKGMANELGGVPQSSKQHFIPHWALGAFLACLLIVGFLLLINWFCVSRKLLRARSNVSGGGSSWKAGGFVGNIIKKG